MDMATMTRRDFRIRQAGGSDIPRVAQLFRAGFSDTFAGCGGEGISDLALADVFAFLLDVEPEGFFVADASCVAVGYCITPYSMRRIWWQAFAGGYIARWLWRWLRGEYRLGVRQAWLIISDKVGFALSPHNHRRADAQILSLTTDESWRGRGIARALLAAGLNYLTSRGVEEIKLEVRPANEVAKRLYSGLGFVTVGTAPDRRGGWIVMRKSLVTDPRHRRPE